MKEKRRTILDLAALLVLTTFALCVLLVLLTGTNLYRSLVEEGDEGYLRRTALQYLTTRIRQAETAEVGTFEGCDVLILREEAGAITRVYCFDGWLRELYAVPEAQVSPGDGERLLEAESLSVTREDRLLMLTLGSDTLYLWLPTGSEVGP